MRIRVFYGAFLLLPLLASAQKPPIPAIGESIEVSIVNVDVFVTTKDGQRVRGLTKDDFEIFENGKKQPITNFAEYSCDPCGTGSQPVREGGLENPPHISPQERTVILFFDRFHLPKFRNDPFFASIKKLVHDTVRPADRAMVVTWNRGVLLTVQDFTDSISKLDRAIDAVANLSSKPLLDRTSETRAMIEFTQSMDDWATANGISSVGASIADLELESVAMREKWDLEHKIQTVNALIRSIAAVEGKKVLILGTHRLSRDAGAEHYYAVPGKEVIPSETRNFLDMRPMIKKMEETANANGVTIYPIFPEGLVTADIMNAAPAASDYRTLSNETPMLTEIAEETGGMTAWGSTDIVKLLPRIEEDLDSYYSLAYRIQGSGADKARNIVVKTKNPSLVVRSRREFLEKSDVTRMEDRVIAALFRTPPSPGTIPLNVALGERKQRGKQYLLPVTVHIPVSALTSLPQGNQYAGAFSVYLAWGGTVGGVSDTTHQTRTFRIPAAEVEKAKAGHLTYEIDLNADQRTTRVALGVIDEVSKEFALRLIQLRP
jgi:VWFA-related protein